MLPSRIPQKARLERRWCLERVVAAIAWWSVAICGVSLLLGAVLAFIALSRFGILIALGVLGGVWLLGVGVVVLKLLRKPGLGTLVKRADAVLRLPDDLLTLSELNEEQKSEPWRAATWQKLEEYLTRLNLREAWPVRLSRRGVGALIAAGIATGLTVWLGGFRLQQDNERVAREAAAQEERLAAGEELLKDWKEFAEKTDDPELKKLFAEAEKIREALKQGDPMVAMLAMDRLDQQLNSLQAEIDKDSISAQAGGIADAMESFAGAGAMSAALRNQNYEQAATEAEKLREKLAKDPTGKTEVKRDAAASEMLQTEAKKAANRGNQSLSDALNKLSQLAQSGSVANSDLQAPLQKLQEQYLQECSRQGRGLASRLGKKQMETLRRRLRGEEPKDSFCQSLCQSCLKPGSKPGGNKAGRGAAGDPRGTPTELASAGVQEQVSGTMTDGETEVTVSSSASGAGGAVNGGRKAAFSDYVELSQKAVADENLPLAYRQVIRAYFEKIRPVAESQNP
ncbi:hypothetical protein TSACC_21862 [Terrimicrobium sacchariphilum]|uniref:Uncharacterized protein n=1 Tax=Terrimicrobium sacchariphilum TaxID=690879 RepID=A0A146GA31_TERSA|nr:hypothetical protein [Terrimicrobium sacchariphilum]GAT33446.1 hypothetical protein TSACC_21862 [Terrimicrobium sacchariphilum]